MRFSAGFRLRFAVVALALCIGGVFAQAPRSASNIASTRPAQGDTKPRTSTTNDLIAAPRSGASLFSTAFLGNFSRKHLPAPSCPPRKAADVYGLTVNTLEKQLSRDVLKKKKNSFRVSRVSRRRGLSKRALAPGNRRTSKASDPHALLSFAPLRFCSDLLPRSSRASSVGEPVATNGRDAGAADLSVEGGGTGGSATECSTTGSISEEDLACCLKRCKESFFECIVGEYHTCPTETDPQTFSTPHQCLLEHKCCLEDCFPDCEPEICEVDSSCETCFAKDETGCCFGDECSVPQFTRWGWTNGPYTLTALQSEGVDLDIWCAAGQCDTGKGILGGTLTLSVDAGNIVATLGGSTQNQWELYIGCAQYPMNKNGDFTVAPGQYPYKIGAAENKYTVDDLSIDDCFEGKFYVIAHFCGVEPETTG
jgi:hypothetical protein